MKETWHKDGLTRKKQAEALQINSPFLALESDFSNLLARAMHSAGFIHFYDSIKKTNGHFADLYRYQPVVILNEIQQFDSEEPEQMFISLNDPEIYLPDDIILQQKNDIRISLQLQLQNRIYDWDERLNHRASLHGSSFHSEMKEVTLTYSKLLKSGKFKPQQLFYFLLQAIRNFQSNYNFLLQELLQSGTTDPSFAVLLAFINNYGQIASRFNDRWKEYPEFYLQNVLQVKPDDAYPDNAWFLVEKEKDRNHAIVPPDTGFITKIQQNEQVIRYKTLHGHVVNNMQLISVTSLVQEKNKEKFPACKLKYVTTILRSNYSNYIDNIPGKQDNLPPIQPAYASVGLIAESSMLLLKEGVRTVTVRFGLTNDFCIMFEQLITQIGTYYQEDNNGSHHPEFLQYKILNDAFYLELSTGSKWMPIPGYSFSFYNSAQYMELVFRLDESYPASAPCNMNVHGCDTVYPALRILMNRDAWLYPYSWATQMEIEKISISVDVKGITSMEIHNEAGLIDHTVPFQLFGPIPEKGSWLVFGNYEIALKSANRIDTLFYWKQLPSAEFGFYDRYKDYPEAIDNTSFIIRTEQLNDKKWKTVENKHPFLFSTLDNPPGEAPSPRSVLSNYSTIAFYPDPAVLPVTIGEESFDYGLTRSGFFRIVLEQPDMGFGQKAYQRVFSEIMMKNSYRKKKMAPPEEPLIPTLEHMELSYKAHEESLFIAGGKKTSLQLYHINPLKRGGPIPTDLNRPVSLAKGPENEGNLLFSIQNATGANLIRLFIEMAPLKQQIEKENIPEVSWHYHNGNQWCELTAGAILRDETDNLLCSGLIEIFLPHPIMNEELDENGNFRISAGISRYMGNYTSIRSLYLNPVEAQIDLEQTTVLPANDLLVKTTFEKNIPGLAAVYQITPGRGGKNKENEQELRNRTTQETTHRNRAVNVADYEQMILTEFPEIIKVLCLPGIDSKNKNRKAIVSLVLMQREAENNRLPLCEHKLLKEVEKYMNQFTSPFITIDAIPPVYESVTVKCWLNMAANQSPGQLIQQAENRINNCIAPWTGTMEIPAFGYSFSSADLYNSIREDKTILSLTHLSVLHVTSTGDLPDKEYILNRHFNSEQENFIVSPSAAWCILVPDKQHLIHTSTDSPELIQPGIGDLRIGGTFIVNK